MDVLLIPGRFLSELSGLPPESSAFLAIQIVANLTLYCFVLRTIAVFLSRWFGVYHPKHYSYWPRLPWRPFLKVYLSVKRWYERVFQMGKHATGGFADVLATFTLMFKPGQILLGRAYGLGVGLQQPIGINVTRHLFMYAMTGAGKTTALITILSTWIGSAYCIDPKAQITNALFQHDERRWVVLDPYGISMATSACFNAIDCIKEAMQRDGTQAAVLWAMRAAQALIVTPAGSRTPYFCDTARGFLVGLILHVMSYHPEDKHNLPHIRDLIVSGYRVYGSEGNEETTGDDAHQLLLRAMQNNPAFDGAIAGAAAAMSSASGETGGNVRSTLQEQTKWLDIPAVRKVLCSNTMPLSELKTRNDVVFSLTAPVLSIREELAPLSRLLTNMTAYTFEAVKKKNGQCLTIIDELPSQGYNETLEVMLAVARSYGQTVLGISQNVDLMKKNYPKSWATFSGEADAVYWMATNHNDTAAHLSQALGKKSYIEKDPYSGRKSYRDVTVMDADQVKRFLTPGSDNLIVTRAGARALKLKNEPYFKALPVWNYAADPDHKEAFLRRMMRKFLASSDASVSPTPIKQANPVQSVSTQIPRSINQVPINQESDMASKEVMSFTKCMSSTTRR